MLEKEAERWRVGADGEKALEREGGVLHQGGGCYYLGTPDCSGWGSVWAEFFAYESARFPLSL